MEFRILGPLEVWEAGQAVTLSGAKPRALLAILLMHPNRVVATDRLIDLLWGETPSETVSNTLQVCVSKLRRNLEPGHVHGTPHQVVIGQAPGYLIRIDPEQLDLTKFERLVGDARQSVAAGDPEAAAASLRAALGLWRGPAFANLANESFTIAEANRLGEMRLRALEDRIDAELVLGRHADLVGELELLVAEHPLRERLRGQLMLALYRSGRRAEATDMFYRAREVLVEEAGIEPGQDLQKLLKAILSQDPSLDLPPRVGSSSPRTLNNLPFQMTSFVGRAAEVAEARRILPQTRLLTLTGTGGIGKTRLAIELARNLVGSYPDGVWLVELASLTDPDLLPQTIAFTLGLAERGSRPLTETLVDYLRTRRLLLILDNCEHLVDACAWLAKRVLEACPELQILATSREALGVDGETSWRVPSLSLPNSDQLVAAEDLTGYEAVALFSDRAVASRGSFTLNEKNSAVVVELCRRLDGIPLAIELAAARLTLLSVDQIMSRLNDRFRILSAGSRTALPRQQTLTAAIDWSYDLLPETERALLRGLSVFAGGISLEAAEAVCGAGAIEDSQLLDRLSQLVHKSLVLVDESGNEARYRLLETIRHYGRDKLVEHGEAPLVRNRHQSWFIALAERADPQLRGPDQLKWSKELELEYENIRAALEWSFQTDDPEAPLHLAAAMGWFWRTRGHLSEGRDWLERALDKAGDSLPSLRSRALVLASILAGDQGDHSRAVSLGTESLTISRGIGEPWAIAFALQTLGRTAAAQDNFEHSSQLLEESLSMFREAGDKWAMSRSLYLLGLNAYAQGQYPRAATLEEEALKLGREVGDKFHVALALQTLAQVDLAQGNYGRASSLLEEALTSVQEFGSKVLIARVVHFLGVVARCRKDYDRAAGLQQQCLILFRDLGNRQEVPYALCELGIIAHLTGDAPQASSLLRESLRLVHQLGDRWMTVKCLEALATVAVADDPRRSAGLFGAGEALREQVGAPIEPSEKAGREDQLGTLRTRLGRSEFTEAWQVGHAMAAQEMVDYALEEAEAAVQVR